MDPNWRHQLSGEEAVLPVVGYKPVVVVEVGVVVASWGEAEPPLWRQLELLREDPISLWDLLAVVEVPLVRQP